MTVVRDSVVLSDIELVLPYKVICDFQSLEKNARACYIAVNKDESTSTQLTVDKQGDESVRLRVTGRRRLLIFAPTHLSSKFYRIYCRCISVSHCSDSNRAAKIFT
jgi:hypothetical protein